ncbi:hypothetical protein, partial [Microbacterium sp. SCN 70-27]|uniref:hypothetical protein n=1 Tax=Microbacterium sp. SCN 70-27 TaxID=1660114 RepID=UPI0025E80937
MDVDPIPMGVEVPMVRRGAHLIAIHVDGHPGSARMWSPVLNRASQGRSKVRPQARLIHCLSSTVEGLHSPHTGPQARAGETPPGVFRVAAERNHGVQVGEQLDQVAKNLPSNGLLRDTWLAFGR